MDVDKEEEEKKTGTRTRRRRGTKEEEEEEKKKKKRNLLGRRIEGRDVGDENTAEREDEGAGDEDRHCSKVTKKNKKYKYKDTKKSADREDEGAGDEDQ